MNGSPDSTLSDCNTFYDAPSTFDSLPQHDPDIKSHKPQDFGSETCTPYKAIFMINILLLLISVLTTVFLTSDREQLTGLFIILPLSSGTVLIVTLYTFCCSVRVGCILHLLGMSLVIPVHLIVAVGLILYSLNVFTLKPFGQELERPSAAALGCSYILFAIIYSLNLVGIWGVLHGAPLTLLGLKPREEIDWRNARWIIFRVVIGLILVIGGNTLLRRVFS